MPRSFLGHAGGGHEIRRLSLAGCAETHRRNKRHDQGSYPGEQEVGLHISIRLAVMGGGSAENHNPVANLGGGYVLLRSFFQGVADD